MDIAPVNHIEIVDDHAMIQGKHVKVHMVISMLIRAGASVDEVMEQYQLTPAEIHAALAYYYDNQSLIDQSFHEGEVLAQTIGKTIDDLRARWQNKSASG
jgi:uncharacterized protein (DUF433 family)